MFNLLAQCFNKDLLLKKTSECYMQSASKGKRELSNLRLNGNVISFNFNVPLVDFLIWSIHLIP